MRFAGDILKNKRGLSNAETVDQSWLKSEGMGSGSSWASGSPLLPQSLAANGQSSPPFAAPDPSGKDAYERAGVDKFTSLS